MPYGDVTRQPQGYEHRLGVALETAYGQFVAPTSWFGGDSAIQRDPGYKLTDQAVGSKFAGVVAQYGVKVAGQLTAPVVPGRCQELMTLLVSGYACVEEDPDGVLHNAAISIYEEHSDELSYEIVGAVADNFNLRCSAENDLMAEIDMVAREKTAATGAQVPNYTGALDAFIGQNLAVADEAPIDPWDYGEWQIKFSFNLKKDRYGHDLLLAHIPCGAPTIEITPDLLFINKVWRERGQTGEPFPLDFLWTRGARSVELIFPFCRILGGYDTAQAKREEDLRFKPTIHVLTDPADQETAPYTVKVDGSEVTPPAGGY
jgi:hypothetical protein